MAFIVNKVEDKDKLQEIYRLRYKVYCEEWGFEKPEHHPGEIETDIFDKNAVHFIAENGEGNIVGTIRLILSSAEGFPLEKYCEVNINKNELPRENLAEISRLAISKQYRRRTEDKYIYGPDEERRSIGSFNNPVRGFHKRYADRSGTSRPFEDRRVKHEAVVGLYKAVYQESKRRNITHWYAVMTKGLYILLSRLGINFQPIGDPVDYHGIRTPYLGDIEKMEREVSVKNPEIFEDFTGKL
jgi:N-acyl-L-homoserine lactone synthetase